MTSQLDTILKLFNISNVDVLQWKRLTFENSTQLIS